MGLRDQLVTASSEPGSPREAFWRHRGAWLFAGVMVTWLALMWATSPAHFEPIACKAGQQPRNEPVVMLSASWCGYCRRARAYFHENKIAHCEYDIETTPEGRRLFAGQPVHVIPIMFIGDSTLVGFNRDEVVQTLIANGVLNIDEID